MTEGFPSKGTLGETETTSTQAHTTAGLKMAGSDMPTTKADRKETEDKAEEKCVAATVGHISEGTPLVLLQVNSRSICNKVFEFWNLIETHKPDVVIGMESWLSEKINNAEVFRDNCIAFRKYRCSWGWWSIHLCYIDCRELWIDEDFEMVAVEVKVRNLKFTWEVVGIYRELQTRTCEL